MHRTLMRLAAAALLAPASALAASCVVAGGDIAFGRLDPAGRDAPQAIGNLQLRCDAPAGSVVRISLGTGNAAHADPRELRDGDRVLRYNLYLEPTHERVFGDDSPGAAALEISLPAPGELVDIPVYGAISPGQALQPGDYSDQVEVTVDF